MHNGTFIVQISFPQFVDVIKKNKEFLAMDSTHIRLFELLLCVSTPHYDASGDKLYSIFHPQNIKNQGTYTYVRSYDIVHMYAYSCTLFVRK